MTAFSDAIGRFRRNEDGTTAIIFGFTVILMFFCVGMAIDLGRAYHAASKAASSLDAAVLAAGREMQIDSSKTDAELTAVAQAYFDTNIIKAGVGYTTFTPVGLSVNRNTATIVGNVSAIVNTAFVRIAGPSFQQIPLAKTSTATYSLRDIEMGMALDITGSMSGTKIADLKVAAKDLIDILMPDSGTPGRKVRIGFAPYAGSVRPGNGLASIVTGGASTDGCVVDRGGSGAYDDTAPGMGSYINAYNGTPANGHYGCISNEVVPLKDHTDKTFMKNQIDAMTAGGWTAGHIGAAWAWYLVSPEWNSLWNLPDNLAPYNDGKTIKAVLLMTDGEFNTSYSNGPQNGTSPQQAIDICTTMKNSDHRVVVYAVAFQAPPAAKATLQACATTSGSPYYFDAANGDELRDAFRNIAINLNNLRLAN
jgi:Flp pilus assembly protein TadG